MKTLIARKFYMYREIVRRHAPNKTNSMSNKVVVQEKKKIQITMNKRKKGYRENLEFTFTKKNKNKIKISGTPKEPPQNHIYLRSILP